MDYYSTIAPSYDQLHGAEQRRKMACVRARLPFSIAESMRLLDIGCGSGVSMEGWGCQVQGIDPSEGLIALAKAKGLAVDCKKLLDTSFEDGAFDIITSFTALHHEHSIAACAHEMARINTSWCVVSYLKGAPHLEDWKRELERYYILHEEIDEGKDLIFVFEKKDI